MMSPELVRAWHRLRLGNRICERANEDLERSDTFEQRSNAAFTAMQAQLYRSDAAEKVRKLLYGARHVAR